MDACDPETPRMEFQLLHTDSRSAATARAAGVDLHAALRGHASYEALSQINDIILTGNTGTNLCDFNIMYVPAPPAQ